MARSKSKAGAHDAPFAPPDWPASRPPEMVKVADITPHPENPRTHPDAQIDGLGAAFDEFGVVMPPVLDENFRLIAGEGRWLAARKKNIAELPCIVVRGWSESKKRRFMVADNRLPMLAGFDDKLYAAVLASIKDEGLPAAIGFQDAAAIDAIIRSEQDTASQKPPGSLKAEFGIVPFSVLNAREGVWQERKQAWIALGIQSEVGRGENLLKFSDSVKLDGKVYQERQKQKGGAKARAFGTKFDIHTSKDAGEAMGYGPSPRRKRKAK